MAKTVRELMKKDPIKVEKSTPVVEAARKMRDSHVGAVIIATGDRLSGIVTDRDIAVRVVAQGLDPAKTPVGDICSSATVTVTPEDEVDRVIQMMREKAVRRVPVVDSNHQAVGILSLGDFALHRDPNSVLGQISAAQPSQH
jgi:CBS domain-containing protein